MKINPVRNSNRNNNVTSQVLEGRSIMTNHYLRLYVSHIRKTLCDAWNRVVWMDFILQIYEALVSFENQSFKNLADWHFAFAYCYLALFALKICEVFHVDVEQARACFVNCPDHIRAGADGVADVNAASHARADILDGFHH